MRVSPSQQSNREKFGYRVDFGCMVKRRWNDDSLRLAVMSSLSSTNF